VESCQEKFVSHLKNVSPCGVEAKCLFRSALEKRFSSGGETSAGGKERVLRGNPCT
jgi:hypothetical protein